MIQVPDEYVDVVFTEWDDDVFNWLLRDKTRAQMKSLIPDLIDIQPFIRGYSYCFDCKVSKKNDLTKITLYNKEQRLMVEVIQKDEIDDISDDIQNLAFW